MEETFVVKFVHAVCFLALCTVIIFVGWSEPLRYRFMSKQEIAEIERPATTPAPTPSWVDGRPGGSRLEEPAQAVRGGRR